MKTREEVLQECFIEISKYHRATAALSVGMGKTFLGLTILEKHLKSNVKFLVVIPKLVLKGSWKDEAIKHKKENVFKHIAFSTYRSLYKLDLNEYDYVILDECHNLLYTHDKSLSNYKGKILGLTGTPPKIDKSEKGHMVNAYCPVKYAYVTDDAVDNEILNDYQIYVHSLELSNSNNVEKKTKTGKTFYTSEVKMYQYWTNRIDACMIENNQKGLQLSRILRMKAIQDFKSKENYAKALITKINNKCLIFANTQEQADRICSISYHSGNPKSEENLKKFKLGEEMVLSCVLQLNEGVNIPKLKSIIIMHSYSNERKLSQRLGRALRLPINEKAIVHILMYKNTIDEEWVANALSDYNPEKIKYLS